MYDPHHDHDHDPIIVLLDEAHRAMESCDDPTHDHG